MNDAPRSLDALRREIDTVDDALHDLLMQRAALVAEIGALKTNDQTSVFRPGREAALLRRLLARHRGQLAGAALAQIWQEIIAASTQIQGGFTIACCPIGDEAGGDRWARRRFGAGAAVTAVAAPAQVVTAVTSGETAVGVVPMPRPDDRAPWWPLLYGGNGGGTVQVVASIPFVLRSAGEEIAALVIANGEAGPSGDDRSLLVFECVEPFSRDRVRSVLEGNGFAPAQAISYDDPARPGTHLHLVDVSGYVALDDPRCLAVQRALPAAVMWRAGAYATPIVAG